MTAQGTRKAAMLLMNLPPGAAAELLRSAKPETMTRILAEVAYLQNQGPAAGSTEPVREFSTLVSKGRPREAKGELAKQIAEGAMGAKAPEVMRQVQDLLLRRDPFGSVRSVPVGALAKTLAGEAPQVVTMVLAELSVAGSTQLLNLLPEETRVAAVQCMAAGLTAPIEVKLKVAAMIAERLKPKAADAPIETVEETSADEIRQQQLRKVALLLRSLEKGMRDMLLKAVAAQDEQTAKLVGKLMVMWEDIPLVADRALQEVLRTVDSRKLALSLVKAEESLARKFRSNMSERAGAMLDEESSLLSSPKEQDIHQCRELILDALRGERQGRTDLCGGRHMRAPLDISVDRGLTSVEVMPALTPAVATPVARPQAAPAQDSARVQALAAQVQHACHAVESAAAQLHEARRQMATEAEEQLLELAIGLARKAMMQEIEAGALASNRW